MKISQKIQFVCMLLVFVSTVMVGVILYLQFNTFRSSLEEQSLKRIAETETLRLSASIHTLHEDTVWFSSLTKGMMGEVAIQQQLELLRLFGLHLIKSKEHYDQIRILGMPPEGRELLRIDQSEKGVFNVPEHELQPKGHRYYYQDTLLKSVSKVFFSEIDLNVEHEKIEIPYRPTLRATVNLTDNQDRMGAKIAVINLNVGHLLGDLFPERGNFEYYLANEAGDYLLHPDQNKTYGFAIGHSYRMQDEFAHSSTLFDSNSPHEELYLDDKNSYIYFKKFFPFPSENRALVFAVRAKASTIREAVHLVALKTIVGLIVVLIVSSFVAYVLALNLTRPINRMTQAIKRYTHDQSSDFAPIETSNDEIGALDKAFRSMRETISEREERILSINNKLMEANTDLAHFTWISSHELREPAKRIAALSELMSQLKNESADPDLIEDLNGKLSIEAQSMLRQITEFREFVNLDQDSLTRVDTNIAEIAEKALAPSFSEIQRRGIHLHIDSLPTIYGYPNLIFTLYRNLIKNALQYVHRDEFELSLTVEETERGWIFGVRNTGSSIDENHREEVFATFVRVDKSTIGGGMGLAICRRIVDRHAGKIWIEGGSDFVHVKFSLQPQSTIISSNTIIKNDE